MNTRKKVERRFLILSQGKISSRQKGMVVSDFITGRVGILYLGEWMRLESLLKAHATKKRIRECVRKNIEQGKIFLGDNTKIPQQEFLKRVFNSPLPPRRL